MSERPLPPAALRALRYFGIEPEAVLPHRGLGEDAQWRAEAGSGAILVRQHRSARSDGAIAWEHELRRYLAEKGWPALPPLTTRDGRDVVGIDGERYSLYPLPSGRPLRRLSPAMAQVLGRLLARFHLDARHFPRDGQPDGLGRAWELDAFAQAAGFNALSELVVAFWRERAALASSLRKERFRLIRDLARVGFAALPDGVVHLRFCREALLFDDGQPVALLEFDLAHRDALAFDLAATLVREAWQGPAAGFDAPLALALLEGYEALRPLEPEELGALPVLVRAVAFWEAARDLVRWWDEGSPRAVRRVEQVLERELPALDAQGRRLLELLAPFGRRR